MITKPTKLILLAFYLFMCGSEGKAHAFTSGMTPATAARLDEIKKLRKDDPTRAISSIDDLLTHGDPSDEEKGWLHYERGNILNHDLNEKDQGLLSLYKALRHFRQADAAEGQHRALRQLGHTYNALYHHSYALEYYQEILSLDLENGNDLLYTRYNIAYTYRLMEEFDTAISMQKEILAEFEKDSMVVYQMYSHLEMGVSYLGLKNWEQARIHYQKVYTLSQNITKYYLYQAKANLGLGFVNLKEGNLERSEQYLLTALDQISELGDPHLLILNYNNLGLLYLAKEDEAKAISYFRKSIALDAKTTDIEELSNALKELISLHEQNEEINQALAYSRRLNEIAVPFIELTRKLEKLHDRYKAEKVHYVIEKFELQESLLKAENRNMIIGIILIGVLLVSLLVYLRFRKQRHIDDDLIQNLKEKYRLLYRISERYKIDLDDLDKQLK